MKCLDCNGRGHEYSDPDHKQLECMTCEGTGEIEDPDITVGEAMKRIRCSKPISATGGRG